MALGQSGPPASPKQVAYLQALLEKAGYPTFREARRAYGLTQRQAGGKFTKQEASALIDRLVNGEPDVDRETVLLEEASDSHSLVLRGMPAQWLADELIRRGWGVTEP
jgi:hypothetical protein